MDKNFSEEKFETNIHHSTIIKLAIIFIGGYLIINYFVPLILELYTFIQNKTQDENFYYDGLPSSKYINLIHNTIMVLIGYFMLGNSKRISNFLEYKRKT